MFFDDELDPITGASRRWCVYLFALADSTSFKVGFTCHPLQRIFSFSSRYYERFDLPASRLLRVADATTARDVESLIKASLAEHRAAMPLWVPRTAGGHTEWFAFDRCPDALVHMDAHAQSASGVIVGAHEFLEMELRKLGNRFESWAAGLALRVADAWEAAHGGWPAPVDESQSLRDWLDAYRHFGIDLFADDPRTKEFVAVSASRRA